MTDNRVCHESLSNSNDIIICYGGRPGDHTSPFTDREGSVYLCSAWNDEHKVCNLTLQPTVVVNVAESSRHNCNCEKD